MITPIVGVGVSFSGTAHEDIATMRARGFRIRSSPTGTRQTKR